MLPTTEIEHKTREYSKKCFEHHKKPSFNGLGIELGISGQTVNNIVKGVYNGSRVYTDKPHITRCVSNDDFNIIRDIYI